MATNFDVPPCPNSLEGQFRCAKSDTYIESEKQNCFVIRCRTCGTINVWPLDERAGKYEANLKRQLLERQTREALARKRSYSY